MSEKNHTLFRPPGEADSLIIRIADGCPWNKCTFCGMYKDVPYQFNGISHAEKEISFSQRNRPNARRIFLADGDVMHLDFTVLEKILIHLNRLFPRLARVGIYANGTSILAKTDEQLSRLKELKLNTLYMGLESGDDETLRKVRKQENANDMIDACKRAQAAGLRMSVMVLTGLAGHKRSIEHARATAEALNQMQPRLLSALRLVTTPNTPLYNNGFEMITEFEAIRELREMIKYLELNATVFRADHSSNIIPLEARLPKDKIRLVMELDALLTSGRLDKTSPGFIPWSL